MALRRKLCRALACPRRIDDDELFCSVHLRQMTPAILAPIADNREAPGADAAAGRRIIAGTADAVAFIAKKEGRSTDLAVAQRTAQPEPGQGGDADGNGNSYGGGDGFRETGRLRPPQVQDR